jgi:predicted O-methyltransferase YrrM
MIQITIILLFTQTLTMDFISEDILHYAEEHTQQESDVLKKLNRFTYANILAPRMLSGHLQGRLLAMFSKMIQPKTILEIGTFTGYSAICLAEGLQPNGILHTIEVNEEMEDVINKFIIEANLSDKIKLHIGNASNIIKGMNEKFDLVFIDADKENYSNYFDLVIDKVNAGGFIIADNVLWSGKVLQPTDDKDIETKAIVEFNKKIQSDNRVENVLIPVRDGLMVVRKKSG